MTDLDSAWEQLDFRYRVCLEEAWISLGRRGLPVGAVVTTDRSVVSRGRNRVYDLPGGTDPLQGTPLAHAEMNALASLATDVEASGCSLWSTHSPCPMCTAAIDFVGLECSKHLARDPSNPEMPRRESEHLDQDGSPWPVVANLMFLHNVAWVGGEENAILVRNSEVEPEVTLLALSTLQSQRLIRAANDGAGLVEALAQTWDEVVDVDQRRRARS